MRRELRPEAGFAGREAGSARPVNGAEEGRSWGKHRFPALLEEDLESRIRRAAALEERDREVEIDVAVERQDERRLAVVAGGDQLLDAPRRDLVALAFPPGRCCWSLNCHRIGENAGHVWRP